MSQFYKLRFKKVIPAVDVLDWARFFEISKNRIIRQNKISKELWISTIFTGLEGFSNPELFETMIFGGEHNHEQYRYDTWEQAINGHKKLRKKLRKEIYGV